MKRILLGFVAITFILISCNKVPLTGRNQLNMLPESDMLALSLESYGAFLKENKVVTGTSDAQMVKSVGNNIATSVENFLNNNGYSERLSEFKWEFNLVDDDLANAWCMPGGKVVFYTGILPVTQTDKGLAVVMGHEVAHAVARHGNERMSTGMAAQLGGVALSVALKDKPQETQSLFYSLYGIGAQVGIMLPYSRTHESEADRLGLIFMAMAGYDPHEAVSFWERMAALGGQQPPEFLSTHPSHTTRINNIKNEYMPEAMKYYKK